VQKSTVETMAAFNIYLISCCNPPKPAGSTDRDHHPKPFRR
jgi:hypothetical protein